MNNIENNHYVSERLFSNISKQFNYNTTYAIVKTGGLCYGTQILK
jgi:hypothetical protein